MENETWYILRAEDDECMSMPLQDEEHHQFCEEWPEELDTEAEGNVVPLNKLPFYGNTSEVHQKQSCDGTMRDVNTSDQDSFEMTSNLWTEETSDDSTNNAARDDYEMIYTETITGKGKELSPSTEPAFAIPNTAISAADKTVICRKISKDSTASYTSVNKLDKDKQSPFIKIPKAKIISSVKELRQDKLLENMHHPTSKGKGRKAGSDMKRLLEHQAEFAKKINARRYEHQLKEMEMMANGSCDILESPLKKRLRRFDEEIALIKGLMDLVKSLTEGEQDHDMCLSAIKRIEAINRNFTPLILKKYPVVVIIFESLRRYANDEKIHSRGDDIYSLFDAMFPKDGFEDFIYAFERARKTYQESFVKEEQFSRKIIQKICESVVKKGQPVFTLESWDALQAERYSIWDKFFQAYDKPKESPLDKSEEKKSMKAWVKKVEEDADDVKDDNLPKAKLRGRKKSQPTSTITKENFCKLEPKVEEKKMKLLKEEDEKPDVKSITEFSELKPDLSLVKIKEENDEKPVVCIKTEFLSDDKSLTEVKRKGRKQTDRKSKQGNQNGESESTKQRTMRKCQTGNSAKK